MAIEHWRDEKGVGERLAAHRLAGLLSIDLEGSERIGAIGAIRTDRSTAFTWRDRSGGLRAALAALDEFAEGALYLVGHNIIEYDLELLARHAPALKLLDLPAIDTLYLSPLAFPENPYHALVKQYQEPALTRVQVNDPLLDAELTLELLADVADALRSKDTDLLLAWHVLLATGVKGHAFDHLFRTIRGTDARPLVEDAIPAIMDRLGQSGCPNQAARIARDALSHPLALTYVLAWLPAAGGNSIIPPYVENRFEPGVLATKLRDAHCGDRSCPWCSEHLDADKALKRWFGFPGFREQPQSRGGESLQRSIVEKHLACEHVLGILPTGTGKSLCYQLPALMRYEATGALTVVISPLVALMADQVTAMRRQGITCATTINGLISMPERAEALAHIRFGDAGIVLVAPEQLRNRSFRKAIAGRRIGAWVVDEAHCLSKWGHDFRPDYRYVARYIAEQHGKDPAPILCLTATAKHDVVEDIREHFEQTLHARLEVIDGGAERRNLEFVVMPTSASQRIEHIHRAVDDALGRADSGGAIVYCATKRSTEETAQSLADRGALRPALPLRPLAGAQTRDTARLPRGRHRRGGRHERVRDGNRQARRARGRACRDSGLARELPPGSRAGGERRRTRALPAAVRARGRRTAILAHRAFAAGAARHSGGAACDSDASTSAAGAITATPRTRSSRRRERSFWKTMTVNSRATAPPTTTGCAPRSRGWRNRSSRDATRTRRPSSPRPCASPTWPPHANASSGRVAGETFEPTSGRRCCASCKP